jgi:hypothetical protein
VTSLPGEDVGRQHLVSKVLLKRWTIDGRLLAFNLHTGTHRDRSPKAEGYVEGFIGHGSGQAKARWREFEDRAHRALCAVEDGTFLTDPADVDSIKGLMGLHLLRSRVATAMWERALERQTDRDEASHLDRLQALINDPEVQDAVFEHLTGLEPAGPDARAHARTHLAEQLDRRLGSGGEAFRDLLVENLERFVLDFAEHEVEIGVSNAELLIGDVPALTVDHSTRSVGFLAGVTLQSADTLFMPLGPHHVAALGGRAGYRDLPTSTAETLNHLQLISAHRKAYMLPGSPLSTAAGLEAERRRSGSTSETSISGAKTR